MSQIWDDLRGELERELAEPITIDALTAGWRIAQRAAGHRHSSDDVLTAYYALREAPSAPRSLDLGTGIGGVGLMTLWGLGERASLACIEAQAISHRLLLANIAGNQLTARVEPRFGDLRELALDERFALVTGSPPYFPLGTGVVPADSQKAHARFELRGDVADYARAAARHLADDGAFVFCFPTAQRERALAAVRAAGLCPTRMRDVIPRAGLRPLFSLFAARWRGGALEIEPPLEVRRADGALSDEMHAVRATFGFA
ncbi:MAG: tRNA1(Val) (adenine(37)-N6)-methyltransferase [Kofleriaceae bacterium]